MGRSCVFGHLEDHMIRKRTLLLEGGDTSLALEQPFWDAIDALAEESGRSWTDVVRDMLRDGYSHGNRASFIRTLLLSRLMKDAGERQETPAVWRVRTGRETGRLVHTFKPLLVVGRSRECDLRIDDPLVSRRHLLLAFDGLRWRAMDLDSKNGTRLGRRKIGSCTLSPDLELKMGDSGLTLEG